MTRAEEFLNSFNRVEKWLKDELNNPSSMGFSEMVRRLAHRKDLPVKDYEDDLLQMAQLRNAIVHEKISDDFIIAEPNQWAVDRISKIEKLLAEPEKVLPRFKKNVTGFEMDLPMKDILKTIRQKRYSQFPLYNKGKFEGLITLRTIGYWLATEADEETINLKNRRAQDFLMSDGKSANYRFVSQTAEVYAVEKMFQELNSLEAVLITKDGNPDGNLLGIIRPRDIYQQED
ncbi:CBS domain-containing protein [Enterococcus sp. LJL120]